MRFSHHLLVLATAFGSPFLFAADAKTQVANPVPAVATPAANPLAAQYKDAEQSFLRNELQAALEKIEKVIQTASTDTATPPALIARAYNMRGLVQFQLKNLGAAVADFDKAVNLANEHFTENDASLHLARYNLANALFQFGKTDDAAATIATIHPEILDKEIRTRYFHLAGNIATAREDWLMAVRSFVDATDSAGDPLMADSYSQKALQIAKNLFLVHTQEALDALDEFAKDHSLSEFAESTLQVIIAQGKIASGDLDSARNMLKAVIEKNTGHETLRAAAEAILAQLDRLTEVDVQTIGVLVPLKGKFGKYGRNILNATDMAIGVYPNLPRSESGSPIRFVVRDSGESPESALEALDQLVFDDHAIAVIGPLLSKQGNAVAQKAQEYGVPLLMLSQRKAEAQLGSYIFPIALSPAQQIRTVLDYAIGKKGMSRFAILAPTDSFGDEYVQIFWDEVESRGKQVVSVERYAPKNADFQEELKALFGLKYVDARALELLELERRREAYAMQSRARGLLRKRLLKAFDPKPQVDFDAVFIPDDPQELGQIAPSFSIMDVENTTFLGINTWNSPELLNRAGKSVQNCLFVDAFFPQAASHSVKEFTANFSANFGNMPTTLEVQAYDAAQVALDVLEKSAPRTRVDFRNGVLGIGTYQGVSGSYDFTPEGVNRSAYLLTVKGNSIVEADPSTR